MKHPRSRRIRRPRPSYLPSEDIKHIEDLLPGTPVVLYIRVSGDRQDPKGQLADVEADATAAGLPVVDHVTVVGSARKIEDKRCTIAAKLYEAGRLAAQHGGVVLAECTSRYARAASHNAAYAPNRCPTRRAIKEVCDIVGVPLATVLHPDLTPAEEKGEQGKRRQRTKAAYGGRPPKKKPGYKKERRLKLLPIVLRMRLQGYSNRAIGVKLGVAERTIRDWLKACDT